MSKHEHDQDDGPLVTIAEDVRQLVDPARHAERFEPYDEQRRRHLPSKLHWTQHPSLLDQLRDAGTAGRGGDDSPAAGYESRPAARLEALDRLHAIDQAVDDWLVRHLDQPTRPTLEQNLRALVGLAPTLPPVRARALAREACRWLTWARVVTGWDSAPWRPNASCPLCEQRGGLRVRLDERAAACLDCGETWDAGTLSLLADHISLINAEAAAQRQTAALLAKDLTVHFPRRGPCLACGLPGEDARHRVIDAIVGMVLAGDPLELVALEYGVSSEAVLVAVAWATHPDQQHTADRRQESTA